MGHRLHDVAVNADGTHLFVAPADEHCVHVVDTHTGRTSRAIELPGWPTSVAVSPAGDAAVVACVRAGQFGKICAVDLPSGQVTATRQTADNPQAVALNPTNGRAYVCNFGPMKSGGGTLSVFRTTDFMLLATVPVGDYPFCAATSPDGDLVYVSTAFDQGSLAVVDASTNQVSGYITGMGADPSGVAVDPCRTQVYVASLTEGYVTVVDTASGTSSGWIDVALEPYDLVLNTARRELYVCHGMQLPNNAGLVTVIDVDALQVRQTIGFTGSGYRIAMDRDGRRVYCVDTFNSQIIVFAVE